MADNDTKPQITFRLTGPREGFTGMLGGRYGFRNGELTVVEEFKDSLKLILCNNYACNIVGEAPIWETKDGASIKVGIVDKPKPVLTSIVGEPVSSVVLPEVKAPTPDVKSPSEPPGLPAGPDPVKKSD